MYSTRIPLKTIKGGYEEKKKIFFLFFFSLKILKTISQVFISTKLKQPNKEIKREKSTWPDLVVLYLITCIYDPPGGPLVSEVGYHPRKKIHVIRVVFQDKAMYARTSFRGAKTCKIGKKGVFLVILTNFWMDITLKLRKTLAKTRI